MTDRPHIDRTDNLEDEIPFQKKQRAGLRQASMDGALNINSMMDIMSILLVFLLASISADPWNKKQDSYFEFASSTVQRQPQDSMALQITKRAIIIDDAHSIPITCKTASGRECQEEEDYLQEGNSYYIDKVYKKDSSETQYLITDLHKVLQEKLKYAKDVYRQLPADQKSGEFQGVTTILADKDIPYRIIAEVVYSAGNAGIDQLRFAVMKTDNR